MTYFMFVLLRPRRNDREKLQRKEGCSVDFHATPSHSGCLVQKKIFPLLTRPQGSQVCQKITFFFQQMKLFSFCAKIAPKRHKLKKTIKIKEKMSKNPVFLDIFECSSILGQSQRTKPQLACLVDPGASFEAPGIPGGGSIVEIQEF